MRCMFHPFAGFSGVVIGRSFVTPWASSPCSRVAYGISHHVVPISQNSSITNGMPCDVNAGGSQLSSPRLVSDYALKRLRHSKAGSAACKSSEPCRQNGGSSASRSIPLDIGSGSPQYREIRPTWNFPKRVVIAAGFFRAKWKEETVRQPQTRTTEILPPALDKQDSIGRCGQHRHRAAGKQPQRS